MLPIVRIVVHEVSYLLSEVEARYGRRISTSADFESLSVVIEHSIGDLISSSTLKRLWGYVTLNPTPRIATLDVLARYVGCKNFRSFCESLKDSKAFVSDFFNADYLSVDDLKSGDFVNVVINDAFDYGRVGTEEERVEGNYRKRSLQCSSTVNSRGW